MDRIFSYAELLNGVLSKWDVSSVTNRDCMLSNVELFNEDLSKWDVSSVTDMNSMFSNAKAFNCDLSKWDVSHVQNMEHMFYDAASFTHIICSAAWARSTAAQSAKEMFTGSSGSLLAVSNKGCTAFDSKAELKLAIDECLQLQSSPGNPNPRPNRKP